MVYTKKQGEKASEISVQETRKYYITFRQALDKRSSHKCFG